MTRPVLLRPRGDGQVLRSIDVRRGRIVDLGADAELHRLAGMIFLRWWILGGRWANGAKADYWHIGLVVPGTGSVDLDLREHLLGLIDKSGGRVIPRFCDIDAEGRSTLAPGAKPFLGDIGRELHVLFQDGAKVEVGMEIHRHGHETKRFAFDPRAAINQVFRAFEEKYEAEVQAGRAPAPIVVPDP